MSEMNEILPFPVKTWYLINNLYEVFVAFLSNKLNIDDFHETEDLKTDLCINGIDDTNIYGFPSKQFSVSTIFNKEMLEMNCTDVFKKYFEIETKEMINNILKYIDEKNIKEFAFAYFYHDYPFPTSVGDEYCHDGNGKKLYPKLKGRCGLSVNGSDNGDLESDLYFTLVIYATKLGENNDKT